MTLHLAHAAGAQTAEAAERIAAALGRSGPTGEGYLASLRADGLALSDEAAPTPCDAPACLLTGQRDRVSGFAGLSAAVRLYDHAARTTISSAGHYLPLEQPAVFAARYSDG